MTVKRQIEGLARVNAREYLHHFVHATSPPQCSPPHDTFFPLDSTDLELSSLDPTALSFPSNVDGNLSPAASKFMPCYQRPLPVPMGLISLLPVFQFEKLRRACSFVSSAQPASEEVRSKKSVERVPFLCVEMADQDIATAGY